MSLYSSPPSPLDFEEIKPTLLVCWWITLCCITIIVLRLIGRYIRTECLFLEDKLVALVIVPILLRMGCVHYFLVNGTNNADFSDVALSPDQVRRKEIASGLVLAARVLYAATLWILTYSVLEFFRRLTGVTWRRAYNNTFVAIRCLLAATFVAVVISTFTECHPASHYWQVIPDPGGPCRQAFAQLITFAICNILNDLALVLFPVPIILSSKMPVRRKVQLILLFSLSLAVVGVTLYRVSNTIARHGSQQYRSLLASVELLFATAASNSLVLGSLVRDRGLKQRRYHIRVAPASLDKKQASPPPMRLATVARHWGSDASLVRELGMGVPRGLRHRADTLNSRANFICQPTPSVSSSHRHRRTQLTPEEEQQLSRDAGTSSHRSSDSSTQKLTGCDDDDDGVVPKPLPPPPPDDCASDIIWYKNTAVSAPAPAAQPNRSMGSVPVSAQQSVTNSGSSVKASLHDEPVSSPTGSDKQSPVPLAVPLCTPPSSTPDHEMKDPND